MALEGRDCIFVLFCSYHKVMIADISVKANEFSLAAIPLALTGCNFVTGTVVERRKSEISYGMPLFFLSFIKDNVMLEHFALQAVCFVRCKEEFVF